MKKKIRKVGVIGSGVMGSGIAAHCANAGIPVVMLDIVPKNLEEGQSRSIIAETAKEKLKKQKPSPIFSKAVLDLIETGNLEDDLDKLKDCDWVVEVVVENLEIKKSLFKNIAPYLKEDAILSSNTSGIPIKLMSEDFDEGLKKRFLVTHFFNPVRYLKLLEIIPGELTDPEIVEFMKDFGENVLGKGVVLGKDTPNFVGNRIGVFSMMNAIQLMQEMGLKVEEVDAVLGKAMARAGSAVFGTADLVGIDTLKHVVVNSYNALKDDEMRETFKLPEVVDKMIEKGLLGRKTKAGFYSKDKKKGKLVLDLETLEYRPVEKPDWKSIKKAKEISNPGERIKAVVNSDDLGGQFAWKNTAYTLIYSLNRLGEITDTIYNIDNAIKWGFNWELGPFEIWDAIGVKESVERMKAEGFDVPEKINILLEKGETFYKVIDGDKYYFDFDKADYVKVPVRYNVILLEKNKSLGNVVDENDSASIIDLGDGVICCEWHTKMNAIDDKIIEMMNKACDLVEADKYEALVVGSQAQHFGAGANIFMLLQLAEEGQWWMIEEVTRKFQEMTMRLKYCEKPTVVAPYGLTLGGACETTIHGHRAVFNAETYIGLVEVGVGLLPAGGGTKEMLIRTINDNRVNVDLLTATQKVFELIAMAKVATSAMEAKEFGFMRPCDLMVMNGDSVIYYAKQAALSMVREGFKPRRAKEKVKVAGKTGYAAMMLAVQNMKDAGWISDYDAFIASKIANVLSGGQVPEGTYVSEDRLLELEREAFVELCAQQKTQERIAHMLKTGKPLRN